MNDLIMDNGKPKKALRYLESQDDILLEPFVYITKIEETKDIWRELGKAFNYWINVPEDTFKVIDDCYWKLNYSDLLLDDLQNDAASRGNHQSANTVYGFACSLNSLAYVHQLAASKLTSLNCPETPTATVYIEKLENTAIARWMELYWRDNILCPTEDEYYHMIIKKTHGLFTTKIKLMQLFSTNQDNFSKLSAILGLYFHILEDYRFFISADESASKIYQDDITLTGFSLPIVHALKSKTNDEEKIIDILHRKTTNEDLKKYFVTLLDKNGSLEYTRKILIQLREEALQEIKILDKNPLMDDFIKKYLNAQLGDTDAMDNGIGYNFSHIEELDQPEADIVVKAKQDLLKPYKHSRSNAKAKVILSLLRLFNNSYKAPREKFAKIIDAYTLFGYMIILLDDLQDGSVIRHGVPCAHLIYGIPNTANCIFYMQAASLGHLLKLKSPEVLDVYYTEVLDTLRGQGMDLYWRDNFICPTEEEYLHMVDGKSSGLMRMSFKSLKLFATNDFDIEHLATPVGVYFQVQNDYENLNNRYSCDEKGFCEDLTEGKFGFPTIHAINTNPEKGEKILDILRQRTQDIELKKYCLSLIEECGSLEYTKSRLLILQADMNAVLNTFEDGEVIIQLISKKFRV